MCSDISRYAPALVDHHTEQYCVDSERCTRPDGKARFELVEIGEAQSDLQHVSETWILTAVSSYKAS